MEISVTVNFPQFSLVYSEGYLQKMPDPTVQLIVFSNDRTIEQRKQLSGNE